MAGEARAHILVSGLVQGVGYRFFAARRAEGLALHGFAKNLADGRVEIDIEGDRGMIGEFIAQLRIGPRSAQVNDVALEWEEHIKGYQGFVIR